MVKNLCLKGAGTRIVAEIGAIYQLDKLGYLKNIERLAGTSAGSITSCLLSMRYDVEEIKAMISETDFKQFEDGNIFSAFQIISHYGLHPGDAFLKYIQEKIKAKTGNPNSTFSDFTAKGYLDLYIFAANLNTQQAKRFSFKDTPDVPVAFAVRASMSIPLFFQAFKLDGEILVDGGTVMNYPITTFDNVCPLEETLGICFKSTPVINNGLNYNEFGKYIKNLAETSLNAQDISTELDPEDMKRSIQIDGLGISAIDFSLTEQQKMALFEAGKVAVSNYFSQSHS